MAVFQPHGFGPARFLRPELRRLIETYKAQGTVFDMVIVDYADLMAPERVTDNVQGQIGAIQKYVAGVSGGLGQGVTNDSTPTVNGTAAPGATVTAAYTRSSVVRKLARYRTSDSVADAPLGPMYATRSPARTCARTVGRPDGQGRSASRWRNQFTSNWMPGVRSSSRCWTV